MRNQIETCVKHNKILEFSASASHSCRLGPEKIRKITPYSKSLEKMVMEAFEFFSSEIVPQQSSSLEDVLIENGSRDRETNIAEIFEANTKAREQ